MFPPSLSEICGDRGIYTLLPGTDCFQVWENFMAKQTLEFQACPQQTPGIFKNQFSL
jgi:hypothetical protein